MHLTRSRLSRPALVAVAVVLTSAAVASSASAMESGNVTVTRTMMGAPLVSPEESGLKIPHLGTVDLNKVGIIKIAPSAAKGKDKNVLVLEPGTSAAAAYFVPFAKSLVEDPELNKHWQVWAVERRENFLENQRMLNASTSSARSPRKELLQLLPRLSWRRRSQEALRTGRKLARGVRQGMGYERLRSKI